MRAIRWIVIGLMGLHQMGSTLADSESADVRFTPYNCEKWESRIDAMANASDPMEEALGDMLQQPELSYCQTRRVRVQGPEAPEEPWFDWNPDLDWLANLMQILAIAVLVALVVWLLSRLQPGRWMHHRKTAPGKAVPDDQLTAIDVPTDDDLEHVVAAAETAWASGDRRRALSLLYRGALVRIWPKDRDRRARTEREVLAALRADQAPEGLQTTMHLLTRAWQQSAWAHRPPSDEDFVDVRDRWLDAFDPGRVADA